MTTRRQGFGLQARATVGAVDIRCRYDKGASEIQNKKNKEHRTIRAKPKQEIQKTEINNLKQKGKVMKGKQGIIYCVFALMITHVANAETCIPTTFNVTYSCNGGTLAGTLPTAKTAEYGTTLSPTAITESMCTPPSGYVYGGQAVLVDGEEVAYYNSTSSRSFTFYYTTDIEIGPHWVPVATPVALTANLAQTARSYVYDKTAMRWTANFWYGAVSGVAKCSTIMPENTASGYSTGLIASDQDAIESVANSGKYCYCKMTEPLVSGSPWVFANSISSAAGCVANCAATCGSFVQNYAVFRASVFAAVGN